MSVRKGPWPFVTRMGWQGKRKRGWALEHERELEPELEPFGKTGPVQPRGFKFRFKFRFEWDQRQIPLARAAKLS